MKKLLVVLLTAVFLIGLTACSDDETQEDDTGNRETSTVQNIVTVLENAGYDLTQHEAEAVNYFQENTIDELGVDATVIHLYMGYQNGDNWVQVIGLNQTTEAIEVENAFNNQQDEGQLVYRDGNTVMLTYTQATYDLFD